MGLIYLTLSPTVYATLSATPFVTPPNPGATAITPPTATASQISSIRRAHDEAQETFKEYVNTDKALKNLPIGAVDDIFLRAIRARYIGYAKTTTLHMLTHL